MTTVWFKVIHGPKDHPLINRAELDYIEQGGALVDMDRKKKEDGSAPKWSYLKQLLGNRMLLGVYLGQYCIATVTAFFLTWFPIYLVQTRGMSILKVGLVAAVPALCGFGGGILGGLASDSLLRAGHSLTFARKLPIVVGMLMSVMMVACDICTHGMGRGRHYGGGFPRERLWRAGVGCSGRYFPRGGRGPQRRVV